MQAKLVHELSDLILRARDRRELEVLLQGLLTPQEIEEVVHRWRLLACLLEGRTQRDISDELGISLGKIARGSRLLQFGPQALRRLLLRFLQEKKEEEGTP
ncbi:MAG: transcriptional regulator [Lentisphaeria bacterium]|nr:transcriptional regulator [Lentisphaeria bacterium]